MSAFPTPSQYRRGIVATCSALAATLAVAAPALAGGTTPEAVMGNPTCADVGSGLKSVKIDPVPQGTTSLAGRTIVVSGRTLDWTSTDAIAVVIVKGGPNANIYRYDPASTGDTGLHAPANPKNGQYYGLSHVDFCRGASTPTPPVTPDPPVDPPKNPPVPPTDPCADGTCGVTPEPPTKPETPKKPVTTTIPSTGGVLGAKGVVSIRTVAAIHQRKQCVSRRFTQVVTGKGIKRVTLTINGRVVGRMKGNGKRFTLSVDPSKYGSVLRMSARAEFVKGSGRKAKTMRVTVLRCLQSRGIRFTG